MSEAAAHRPGIARWLAGLVAVGAFALIPSKACACLETYQLSPVRMVLSVLVVLVFAVVALSPHGRRAVWGASAGLVAFVSCAAALAMGSRSLSVAVIVLVGPLLLMVLLTARHRLHATGKTADAL